MTVIVSLKMIFMKWKTLPNLRKKMLFIAIEDN